MSSSQANNDWNDFVLDDLAHFINGRAFKPAEWSKGGTPIIRIEQITNPDAEPNHYRGGIDAKHAIATGDLIFSWSATLKALIWNRGDAVLNQHLYKVIPKDRHNRRFLHQLINFLIPQLSASSHGSTMKHITRRDMLPFPVKAPEPEEQRRIAEILDTADEAIQKTEALIAKLKQMKAGLLHDLLTRGIDDNGELRPKSSEPPHPDVGIIPTGWNVFELNDVCRLIKDGTHLPPKRTMKGPLLLGAQNVVDGRIVRTDNDTRVPWSFFEQMHRKWKIEKDDVLLTIIGTVGRCALVKPMEPFTLQRNVALLRGIPSVIGNDFLCHVLSGGSFQMLLSRCVNKTAQPALFLNALGKLKIAVPPTLEEQSRIVTRIASIDSRLLAEAKVAAKLHLQKSGLMHDLLTGKKRVQQLTPASV